MSDKKHILIAGATGLVGNLVVDHALEAGHRVTTVGRRATGKVEHEILTSFGEPVDVPKADAVICALGTTIADAGSKAAFRAVDFDAVMFVAEAARQAGIDHFIVVTAIGASTRAAAFYSRVKGEVEQALESVGFSRLDIAQPGLLLGEREQHRPAEAFFQRVAPVAAVVMRGPLRRYSGIHADVVARALVTLVDSHDAGAFRYENTELMALS